jgi:hypothetical protein
MKVGSMPAPVSDVARQACAFWTAACSALVFSVLRAYGQDMICELERRSIRRHQETHFLEGLRKLGLDGETSDVVRCAKYHYFSNTLGGLPMDYVQESPDKVWIRYLAPFWLGDSPEHPGAGPAVFGSAFGRAPYLGWHANNGAVLGNDRLVFVHTQSLCDGDPWDAGYFTEGDTRYAPGQAYLRRVGEWGPRFDAARAPELPHGAWPAERRARAQLNYAVDFTASRIVMLAELVGEEAPPVLEHAFTVLLVQRLSALLDTQADAQPGTLLQAARAVVRTWAFAGDTTVELPGAAHELTLRRPVGRLWRMHGQPMMAMEAAMARAWCRVLRLHAQLPGLHCEVALAPDGAIDWRLRA